MTVAPPSYRVLSPIGYWVCWAFVPFNIILAVYLFSQRDTSMPAIIFSFEFWAFLFMLISGYLFMALIRNDIKHIRTAMILGVIFKTYWAWALFLLAIHQGFARNLYLLDLWFMVAFVQAVVAIYVPPRIDYDGLTNK